MTADPGERAVDENMGGHIAAVIERVQNARLRCFLGFNGCRRTLDMTQWYAYPHPGGVPDGQGMLWWLYLRCGCGYDYSWWKIESRVEATRRVSAGEGMIHFMSYLDGMFPFVCVICHERVKQGEAFGLVLPRYPNTQVLPIHKNCCCGSGD